MFSLGLNGYNMFGRLADTMGSANDDAEVAEPTGEPHGHGRALARERDELTRELEQLRAELRRAREDLDVFSQLTSGYWWFGEREASRLNVRAWTTRSFARTTGHERDFVESLASGGNVHPEDGEAFARTVSSVTRGAAEGGRDQAVHEFRLFARDGSIMWVRQRLEGRGVGDGRRVYASGELVTERKRTEDALGHVEARFLSLVEHAPNVIITIDLEGTILFVNRQVPTDGREPWELIGSSAFELADPSRRHELREAIREIVASKQAHEFALRGVGPRSGDTGDTAGDELARWYEVQGAPVIRSGDVVAITMILSDVTERRLAEQALRRSESRWRFLWENVPDLIAELNADGRIVVINRAFGEQPAERLHGTLLFDLPGAEAGAALRQALETARRTGGPASCEIVVADGSGRERWWSNRVVPLAEGGFLLIGTDVSDRRAAERERANLEAQLRQQQKLESIGTLAAGVAHEINNPIQSIMNYADLVRLRADPGGVVADFANEIVTETERVANIVRNLLAFARQEKEHHSPARLLDIVESTLTLMRTVLRRDHIVLDVDVPADLPRVKCRSQQLQQVFMNLLGNARDALNARYPDFHPDKRISIVARTVERDGEAWVCTAIEDFGTGIPAELIERIFDPFFTTKGRNEGTGLGLSVSHGIVREHRGELEVESELGKFTRFHLRLRVDNGWGFEMGDYPEPGCTEG
jgi:PAS domain S-box-containing protein